jgi:UDP-GlcNAc3NAcA epimerase
MPRVLTIVGARPQFVKASALSRAFLRSGIEEILVHTGQHFDDNMADIFFRQMEIPEPAYNLEIHSLPHGAMTGRMTEEIEKVIQLEKPSVVMVYGDTNSTLAGALAAVKLHIPVAHVEAGLRSFNLNMPEEINRILTDRISSFLFCPTEQAVENLKNEGFDHFPSKVFNTGDVMYDVALHYGKISPEKSLIIRDLGLSGKPFILVTLHRQENTDSKERLSEICDALNQMSHGSHIVLPLHPRTKKVLDESKIFLNFNPIDPVGYFDMIELMKHCNFVLSDSGGVQKEAFFFKKHCLVARDETEWTELVGLGYNFIVGADKDKILAAVHLVSGLNKSFTETPYGSGDAAEKIVEILKTNPSIYAGDS